MLANDEIYLSEMMKIKKDFLDSIKNYKKIIFDSSTDAPIEVLCLSKTIETILKKNKITRISHLVKGDVAEVKGLGKSRISEIESRLAIFLPF